ncbi:response regulator transcription factor [Pseudomonas sp. N40(2020)]|uniref:response regulator transcription factor n=1 Tax=Pseudomonas sp. N40(2020) TaxID=2767798 RepID=UPI00223B4046|nr:LuxR C-terminal-related transcriptional regulator [Pseudomonas sp. N40(2020)]
MEIDMKRVITFGALQGFTGILAEQELRAALAICAGLANKEIARAVGCAPSTVKKSIERVFYKLHVSSRSALVTEAFKRGVIVFAAAIPPAPDHQSNQDSEKGVFIA